MRPCTPAPLPAEACMCSRPGAACSAALAYPAATPHPVCSPMSFSWHGGFAWVWTVVLSFREKSSSLRASATGTSASRLIIRQCLRFLFLFHACIRNSDRLYMDDSRATRAAPQLLEQLASQRLPTWVHPASGCSPSQLTFAWLPQGASFCWSW